MRAHTATTTEQLELGEQVTIAGMIRAWLMASDPVQLARRHLLLIGVFLFFGLLHAALIRFALITPEGDLVSAQTFSSLLSTHGTLMFYFVLLPAFPGVLGHAQLSTLTGARGLAFPRLGSASWQLLALGGFIVLLSALAGGTESRWSFDGAFGGRFENVRILPYAAGVFLAAVALALMGVNFVTTILKLHGGNVTRANLPPFAAALFLSSIIAVVACPLLASCMAMVAADRLFGLALFDPAAGGDPQLFKSIFWMFGTPALYMVLLPALGAVSHIFDERSEDGLAGGLAINRAFTVIAALSFLLWGQHFLAGQGVRYSTWLSAVFTAAMVATVGFVLALWLTTLSRGLTHRDAAATYALGFLVTIVVGAASGVMLALPPLNTYLHNTTFVTAHMHLMTVATLGMAFLGALHLGWPLVDPRDRLDTSGRGAAMTVIAGVYLTFVPLFAAGLRGALRAEHAYDPSFQVYHVLSTAGMTVLLTGLVLALASLARARRRAAA